MRPCPACREHLSNNAQSCPSCGWVDPVHHGPPRSFEPPPAPEHKGLWHAVKDVTHYAFSESLPGVVLVLGGASLGWYMAGLPGLAFGVILGVALFAITLFVF